MKFDIGDVVEFKGRLSGNLVSATILKLDYKGSPTSFTARYFNRADGKEIEAELDKNLIIRKLASPSTHKYRVGDVFHFTPHPPGGEHTYEVKALCALNNMYDLKRVHDGREMEGEKINLGTTLISSSDKQPSTTKEKQVDKCKWSTKQPLDVEPVYYRVYKPKVGHVGGYASTSSQKESSNAIVVKRAQVYGVPAVPPCSVTGDLISIIGESVQEGDRWKAEAFLYCEHCDKE